MDELTLIQRAGILLGGLVVGIILGYALIGVENSHIREKPTKLDPSTYNIINTEEFFEGLMEMDDLHKSQRNSIMYLLYKTEWKKGE